MPVLTQQQNKQRDNEQMIKHCRYFRCPSINEQMIKNYRVLLNQAIKHCQMDDAQYPADKWYDNYGRLLRCRKGDFKKHIESQLEPGMTWDNYGTWSLDHMLPVNAFDHTNVGDIVKCWNYTNLKPEWYWFLFSKFFLNIKLK